jgi:hypothetical protein
MDRARTWSELHEQLYGRSWNAQLRRFRSPFAFRGLSAIEQPLTTTLSRLAAAHDPRTLEQALLRNFRKYAHGEGAKPDSVWHWLALGQHHGLPTRLIDWTYSPLVALHFATVSLDHYDRDGVVWCVNFVEANRLLPPALTSLLEAECSQTLTLEMLAPFPTLDALDKLAAEPFVAFVEPPSLDVRMLNQFALFSMMSAPSAQLPAWMEQHPELTRKIVVPAELKWEIRDKLDQANVTERTLFPGLDGLSSWLTRYYLPEPAVRRR